MILLLAWLAGAAAAPSTPPPPPVVAPQPQAAALLSLDEALARAADAAQAAGGADALATAQAQVRGAAAPRELELRTGLDRIATTRDPLRNEPPRWSLALRQRLHALGGARTARQLAQAEVDGVQAEARLARAERAALARLAHHQASLAAAQADAALAEAQALATWHDRLTVAVEAHQQPAFALIELEAEQADAAGALADARTAQHEALATLRWATATPDAVPTATTELPPPPPTDPAPPSPRHQALEAEILAQTVALRGARLAAVPWFDFVQVGTTVHPDLDEGPTTTLEVGTALQLPLGAWWGREGQVAQAELRRLRATQDDAHTQHQAALTAAVARATMSLEAANTLLDLADRAAAHLPPPGTDALPLATAEATVRVARLRRQALAALATAWEDHDLLHAVRDLGSPL